MTTRAAKAFRQFPIADFALCMTYLPLSLSWKILALPVAGVCPVPRMIMMTLVVNLFYWKLPLGSPTISFLIGAAVLGTR